MKSPLANGAEWIGLESVDSTQTIAAEALREGRPVGVVFALDQTRGRGRFGRVWHSAPGDSLTFSMAFAEYADHPRPYLVGMAVALAAAGVLHAHVQWPNDLVMSGKKVGGILTELLPDAQGRLVPVVGLGVNLNQSAFPEEIAHRATSRFIESGLRSDALTVAEKVVARLANLPEPNDWSVLSPIWSIFDATPGKSYLLPTGEIGSALGVGTDGQLIVSVAGETRSVMAAEAFFGKV